MDMNPEVWKTRTGNVHVLARKRRNDHADYVMLERLYLTICPYVVGTVDSHSINNGEWYWGHYFTNLKDAQAFFDEVK